MLARTHISITLFLALLLFPFSLPFLLTAVFATLLPDIDSRFSKIGKPVRILNFFIKHRGIIHSFTFLLVISIFLFLFFRSFLLPFALGYSIHLFLDSLTITGIRPFFPFKFRINGGIKTGGVIETIMFILSIIGILFILFSRFYTIL